MKHRSEERPECVDAEDLTEHREEFGIPLRERSLVHLPDQGDRATLVVDDITPLEPRDREGNGDGPDRGDVLEQRLDLRREPRGDRRRHDVREVGPQGDHQEPKGGDSGRNGTLDPIPSVAFLHRRQEESECLEFDSAFVGGTELWLQPSSPYVPDGRRLP